ncbi:hypothetical protein F4212_09790 [Candidatus Poribacteria bacterium]|nr:hypothetical protein [Candidatus Poribacteria bacterium]
MEEQINEDNDHQTQNINKASELNRLACNLIDEGDLDTAREHLNDAIRHTSNLAEPHTNLGVLHCWEGELDDAVSLHLKALELGPIL